MGNWQSSTRGMSQIWLVVRTRKIIHFLESSFYGGTHHCLNYVDFSDFFLQNMTTFALFFSKKAPCTLRTVIFLVRPPSVQNFRDKKRKRKKKDTA
jgi:hypothetical protein